MKGPYLVIHPIGGRRVSGWVFLHKDGGACFLDMGWDRTTTNPFHIIDGPVIELDDRWMFPNGPIIRELTPRDRDEWRQWENWLRYTASEDGKDATDEAAIRGCESNGAIIQKKFLKKDIEDIKKRFTSSKSSDMVDHPNKKGGENLMAHPAVQHFNELDAQGQLFTQSDAISELKRYQIDFKALSASPPIFRGFELLRVPSTVIAKMLMVTDVTISLWKNGKGNIPPHRMEMLCDRLDILIKGANALVTEETLPPVSRYLEEAEFMLYMQRAALTGLQDERRKKTLLQAERRKKNARDKKRAKTAKA